MGADDEKDAGAGLDTRLDNFFGDDNADDGPVDAGKVKEVDDRLDAFFSDDEDGGGGGGNNNPPPKKQTVRGAKPMDAENSILENLKSIILSLEWEISEELMNRLVEEIAHLEKKHKTDKIAVAFFQLLNALGKYVQKKQADSHPDSIGLINSVYESLEKVMLSEGMSEAEKKKMLSAEVDKYKRFKEELKKAPSKKKARPEPEPPRVREEDDEVAEEPSEPPATESQWDEDPDAPATNRDLLNALIMIQKTLEKEFKSLREEIQALKQ